MLFGFNKNVWLLALIQAIAMTSGTLMVLVAGIFGAQSAPSHDLATLPLAIMILGTASAVMPMTFAMHKFGRKLMFFCCAAIGISSSLIAAYATQVMSFYWFCAAAALLGFAAAGFQQIRFAAIESAPTHLAPKVLSLVIIGGLFAAILGPELAVLGQRLTTGSFTGAFYLLGGNMLLCFVLFCLYQPSSVHHEHSEAAQQAEPRPLNQIVSQPQFIVAVAVASIGYALMAFIMTATPLHMHVQMQHSMVDTKVVIQSHIIAMFAPSFLTGHLITKFKEAPIVIAGLVAYLLAIASAFMADGWWWYWFALVSLGVGWNFLFSSGTSLLTKCYQPAEKFKAQSINEGFVFGTQALASLSAGAVLFALGWQQMMLFCLPIVFGLMLLLAWSRSKARTAVPVH